MAIDIYRKDVETAKAPPERAPGTGFADMIQNRDSEDSAHFVHWVEKTGGDPELVGRFTKGEMEKGDQEKLRQQYEGFEKRKAKVMEVVGQMTPEQLKNLGKRSPFLKNVIELGDASRIASVYQDHLTRLAFEDPKAFDEVEKDFDTLKSFREGVFKTFDDDVTARLKTLGITEQRYSQIMQMSDEKERTKAFKAEVWESFGWWGKPEDWKLKSKNLASQGDKNELDRLVNALEDHEYKLGSALGLLADQNDTIRKAVNQELLGMREKPGKLMSFADGRDALKNFQKTFNIKEERTKFYTDNGYDGKNPAEKKAITRDFNELVNTKFRESVKGKRGGRWLEIFLALFGMKVKETK